MGRTIIQPIGPLYGEPINGTVYGRPNGSIYVPPTNTITLSLNGRTKITYGTGAYSAWIFPCNDSGVIVGKDVIVSAESQDNAAYMATQVSDDSDFTTYEEAVYAAGLFNNQAYSLTWSSSVVTLVDGNTYYARAVLYAATGVPVAYSDVITVTAEVSE